MIRIKKSEIEINDTAYQQALHCRYRVWMVTPQADSACLVEYEMDQESLEELVEDYTRFADILVRIEAVDATGAGAGQSAVVDDSPAV